MLISTCLSDIVSRDYTSQLINNNHELNGSSILNGGTGGLVLNDTDTFIEGDTVTIIDNPTTTNPPPVTKPEIIYTGNASGTFTKNNCATGYQGTNSQYSVSATSIISQVDANQKATALLALAGQAYINTVGQCNCNLAWVEPSIEYKNGKATVVVVVSGAKEYAIGNNAYQQDNRFIIEQDGSYILHAQNGSCQVSGTIEIKLGTDYEISNIRLIKIDCEQNIENDGVISNIKILDRGCSISPANDIDNIRIIQSGCDINQKAEITNIKKLNTCNP